MCQRADGPDAGSAVPCTGVRQLRAGAGAVLVVRAVVWQRHDDADAGVSQPPDGRACAAQQLHRHGTRQRSDRHGRVSTVLHAVWAVVQVAAACEFEEGVGRGSCTVFVCTAV